MLPNKDFFDFKVYPNPNLNKEHPLTFTGENSKKTLIVCKTINEELQAFLAKILAAVKYNIETDIALYNGSNLALAPSFVQFRKTLEFEKFLCFGYSPQQIGLHLQLSAYQKTAWQDCQLLFSQDLSDVMNNVQLKKNLWAALQQMF